MNWHNIISWCTVRYWTTAVMILSVMTAFAQYLTIQNTGYHVTYNARTCLPEYVEWTITPTQLGGIPRSQAGSFRSDKRVPKPRALPRHYTNSGYQRGHLCPSADWSASAALMSETFVMTNVVPMRPQLNMVAWRTTESMCRLYALRYGGVRVRVWTFIEGGDTLYLRNSPVAVPTAFAKQVSTMLGDSLLCEWHYSNR